MTATQRKSRPDVGASGPADQEGADPGDYDRGPAKASTPPPWFRLDASKWRGMTADLKAAERGMLIDLLMQIHQRGEPIINDPTRLARACGTTKVAFERALTTFLADGRIVVSAGKLWSHYIEAELDNCEKRSQAAKEKASKRWEKSQQNQSDADAAAYRYEDSKIGEGEAPSELHPSSDISNDKRPDARRGASGRRSVREFRVGERVDIPRHGKCAIRAIGYEDGKVAFLRVPSPLVHDNDLIVLVDRAGAVGLEKSWWAKDEQERTDRVQWITEGVDPPVPSKMKGRFNAA